MSKLDVTIRATAPNVTTKSEVATIRVAMGVFAPSGAVLNAQNLISSDAPNNLQTGSDGKLLITGDALTTNQDYIATINNIWSL